MSNTPKYELFGERGITITDQGWLSCPNGDDHEVELRVWGEGIDLDFECKTCNANGGIR